MRRHVRAHKLVVFAALLGFALRSPAAAQSGVPGARLESGRERSAAIRAEAYRGAASLIAEWRTAWEARDAATLARLYTDDAAVKLPGRPLVRKRAAVESAAREVLTTATSIAAADIEFHNSGSMAILVSCYYTQLDGLAVTGLATAVLQKSGKNYRIRIHMFDPPQPAGTGAHRFSC